MNSTRLNRSDISQIGGANGYAESGDRAIPSSKPNGRKYILFYELRHRNCCMINVILIYIHPHAYTFARLKQLWRNNF